MIHMSAGSAESAVLGRQKCSKPVPTCALRFDYQSSSPRRSRLCYGLRTPGEVHRSVLAAYARRCLLDENVVDVIFELGK